MQGNRQIVGVAHSCRASLRGDRRNTLTSDLKHWKEPFLFRCAPCVLCNNEFAIHAAPILLVLLSFSGCHEISETARNATA